MTRFAILIFFVILALTMAVTACSLSGMDIPSLPPKPGGGVSGTVTGKICYPSESTPPMTLYFESIQDGSVKTTQIEANQDHYAIDLEPGTYLATAFLHENYLVGGMYSAVVPCGLSAGCSDHSLLPVEVKAGSSTSGIDICDWYAGPGVVPLPPGVEAPEIPKTSGDSTKGSTFPETGLDAYLDLPDRLSMGEKVDLRFVLTNHSDEKLYVLKWYTPLEGIGGEIFKVTYHGQPIPYAGIQASRSAPTADSYVLLNPGESTSATVDLGDSYDFSKAGAYQVDF